MTAPSRPERRVSDEQLAETISVTSWSWAYYAYVLDLRDSLAREAEKDARIAELIKERDCLIAPNGIKWADYADGLHRDYQKQFVRADRAEAALLLVAAERDYWKNLYEEGPE